MPDCRYLGAVGDHCSPQRSLERHPDRAHPASPAAKSGPCRYDGRTEDRITPPCYDSWPMSDTLQRPFWDGHPVPLGDAFEMLKSKNGRSLHAVCALRSHQFGWELVLEVNRLVDALKPADERSGS